MATIAAAGDDLARALPAIERLEAGPGRGQVHRLRRGLLLVDDSYNSSPPALASVLEMLRRHEPEGRRVLVMGDMLELGPMEVALHAEAGRRAAAAGIGLLVTVGTLAREAAEAGRRGGIPLVHHFEDAEQAAESVSRLLHDGDVVVVKGSSRVGLGRVSRAVAADRAEVH
jgi:UDP-N-acetylmuramoyl-tripeptide--D-alanyl-D-alanine ligase